MIRPEAVAALRRWNEVLTGLVLIVAGGWLFLRGGWFFWTVGGMTGLAGAGWAVTGLRRMRFRREGLGVGVVDLIEGQISYFGPAGDAFSGGFVSIPEISELRLLRTGGGRVWRIAQSGGPPVLIPVDALGAERLFDVFAALPGLNMPALLAALDAEGSDRLIWQRPRGRVAGPLRHEAP